MNSMLAQALAVVECARSLELSESPTVKGVYRIGCEPRATASVLRDLAKSIESLDRASAASASPDAVLGAVMRYVTDRGVQPAGIIAHLKRMPDPDEAASLGAIARDDVPELKPQPGEIGAPDTIHHETVDQANIRARTGGQKVAPKFAHTDAIRDQFDPDRVHEVQLGGDDARSLTAVSAMLRPQSADPTVPKPVPSPSPRGPKEHESVDNREMSRSLSAQMDIIGGRLEQVVAMAGTSPRIKGIMADFSRVRERLAVDVGGGEVQFEVNPAMLLAIMRVANEVSEIEKEFAFEVERGPSVSVPGM